MFRISTPAQADKLRAFIGKQLEAHDVRVEVERWHDKRSTSANARLWLLHTKAAEVTGHSAEEMHEFALARYFGSEEVKIGNVILTRPLKRSSALNTKEFAQFMEATEAWYISEFGVWIDG